ncbi:hypothetical protein [Vibrio vulnificus]|uniref:hypothetical protein n=1 Tax=Vibrio vulnificus TaxID=672 RepID=UPI0019D4D7B5|nr:hypothetical protein [Vibrio vulnificus]EJO9871629.1 hypothetical protein [Vibrio vulnificus]MBN8115005.1 hypothetical protein [Vibrio vulnificus]HAS6107040.1 hypothetical protein [Vibrio vulnificus]HDY8048756.1 hypothetical protein [Vibrio vulnificus]HDY8172266.1 hypothetical protein [Vibrio vulnificus]
MLCVNPENGYLAIKQLSADGICQFTTLYTSSDMAIMQDHISTEDIFKLIGAVAFAYGLTFVIKVILQQMGYRQ